MKCPKCGAENINDAAFCKSCGTPLQAHGQAPSINTSGMKNVANNVVKKAKKLPVPAIVGIALAFVILIVCIVVGTNNANTLNLNDYLTMETEGYDGYGKAKFNIDWDEIEHKYGRKIKLTSVARRDMEDFEYKELSENPIDFVRMKTGVDADKISNLSNGDTVTYKLEFDDYFQKYINLKIKSKDGTFKVSGLKDIGDFDAFEGVSLKFEGIAPNGYASISVDNDFHMNESDFELDKRDGLSNGDTVTVTISNNTIEKLAEKNGAVPAENKKTFKVSGLSSYITKINDISSQSLDKMEKQAKDVFDAYVAKVWIDSSFLEGFEYVGHYLLTPKSMNNGNGKNYVYLVYKVNARNTFENDEGNFDKANHHYWYICYENVKQNGDGEIDVNELKYYTPNNEYIVDSGVKSGWSTMKWVYKGYGTLEELYKNVVTANADKYNHEEFYAGGVEDVFAQDKIEEEANTETTEETAGEVDEHEYIGTVKSKVNKLNVRSEASEKSDSIGQLSEGDERYVYEIKKTDKYTWYRIDNDKWVADDSGKWLEYNKVE